ncbi:hypothetical protein ACHAW5_008949 [Stephanodiscus triporus]|uniref:Uncharacterized protein n=1 Tax=Stephanodiscus triporus TaxID=2934178 RepID=A0ABD3NPP5_9STRA
MSIEEASSQAGPKIPHPTPGNGDVGFGNGTGVVRPVRRDGGEDAARALQAHAQEEGRDEGGGGAGVSSSGTSSSSKKNGGGGEEEEEEEKIKKRIWDVAFDAGMNAGATRASGSPRAGKWDTRRGWGEGRERKRVDDLDFVGRREGGSSFSSLDGSSVALGGGGRAIYIYVYIYFFLVEMK